MSTVDEAPFHVPVGALIKLAVPAAVMGVFCSLSLLALSTVAERLSGWLWDDVSAAFGFEAHSDAWTIIMLTGTGLLIGLVVRYAPGHAGPDPATVELVAEPLRPVVLPGLAAALILMLAGGVSLGPENPIIGINVGIIVWVGLKLFPQVNVPVWLAIAVSGTLGAMFGTPVAAALLLSELNAGDKRIPLWDRLFAPLVAATTGALTTMTLADLDLSVDVGTYVDGGLKDLGLGILISLGAAAFGLVAVYLFVPFHRVFQKIKHPVLMLTAGGLLLGVLGAIGGEVTLFKGLKQMQELPGLAASTTALGFLVFAVVKLFALLVAATSGFRGGRIFPTLFIGVALGFAIHQAWPTVSLPLAVGCACVGILVAATRSGWLSIFMAVAVVPQMVLLPAFLLATLVAWLLVTNRPELIARPAPPGPVAPPA
ncbi:ion channel protein [Cellulomonas sp. URHE0023]|uniref:ion channel protein n=1 Tax=Cellulomonas sp. URHE0023 TaxID=1380354 RepID=UPI001E35AC98|nr:ion channel protein [Cellulomonas sp. URHE0023]